MTHHTCVTYKYKILIIIFPQPKKKRKKKLLPYTFHPNRNPAETLSKIIKTTN